MAASSFSLATSSQSLLIQNYETCNIGNDIYMANIREVLREVIGPNIYFIEKPLVREFLLRRSLKRIGSFAFSSANIVDISLPLVDGYKLVVISGPWIGGCDTNEFIDFLGALHSKSIPYAYLSAGSYHYNVKEYDTWAKIFEQYPPLVFSSRDDYTHEKYGGFAKYSLSSICTSFFSPIYFPRAKLTKLLGCWDDNGKIPYDRISSFIDQLGYSSLPRYRAIIDPFAIGNYLRLKIRTSPVNCLLSPSFHDYLDYYSQTDIMISSRVHCCAPVLAYGGRAVLLNSTGRARLFDAIGATCDENIGLNGHPLMSLDFNRILTRHQELIEFLRSSLRREGYA